MDVGSIPTISTLRSLVITRELRSGTATLFTFLILRFQSEECPHRSPKGEGGLSFYDRILLMYYVYILKLKNNTFYTGFSSNLKNRINEHLKGNISQTKNLRPFNLVFYSAFKSKIKALNFEKYLKTSSGFAFRNKRLI